jgi:hypothetical protein
MAQGNRYESGVWASLATELAKSLCSQFRLNASSSNLNLSAKAVISLNTCSSLKFSFWSAISPDEHGEDYEANEPHDDIRYKVRYQGLYIYCHVAIKPTLFALSFSAFTRCPWNACASTLPALA